MLEILGKTNIDFMGKRRLGVCVFRHHGGAGHHRADPDRPRGGQPRHRFRRRAPPCS